jgi:anti-sigma-K factor RskA
MTGPQETGPELPEREILAAEYVLGLLDAEAKLQARGLIATDPDFAADVAHWQGRLAPLLDTMPPVAPGDDMWPRIQAALDQGDLSAEPVVEVLALRRRVRNWKIATGFSAAAAVALAFLASPMMRGPAPGDPPAQKFAAADPLVASIPIGDTPLRLGVTYLPDREEMLVSASGLSADGVHDHELWLVTPDDGAKSLGVVVPGSERRMVLDPALAARINDGAELVLTREPLGGAVPGTDAGPVVASGSFQKT